MVEKLVGSRRKTFVARSAMVLKGGVLGACLSYAALSQSAEHTVLVLQALTGPSAFVGTSVRDGMLLAIEESNNRQELGVGNSIKPIVADDASDRNQTLTLLRRHAADPSVVMVLGPTSGAAAVAAANAANDLQIPLLSTTNSLDVIHAGPWTHILTQPPSVSMPTIVNFAADTLKVKSCAVVGIHDIEIYTLMQKEFEKGVKDKGVKIDSVEGVKSSDADFSALATKLVARDNDCIFISSTAPQGANVVQQLRQAGLDPDVRILGHVTMTSPQLIERGGKAVEDVYVMGDWIVGGRDEAAQAFAVSFKDKYKKEADGWNALGYSAMRVAIQALKNTGSDVSRDALRAALSQTRDVPVVVGNGKYSYDAQRIPNYGMNMLQVKDGQFHLVD